MASLSANSRATRLSAWRSAAVSRTSPVTSVGWSVIIGAALALLTARWTGWQEFAVLAAALLAALVAAGLFTIGRSRYLVLLDLRMMRVVVGEPASGRVLVTSTASRRLFPVRMELPVGAAVASLAVPSLSSGAEHEELFVIPTHRRAVITVGPARSVRGDAFGIFRRVVRWTEPQVLYVHPRTVPLHGAAPGFIKDLEGQATKELSNNDVSFHALRGYVPGDDRRYIHWRTSARTGVLMVRQFEETRRSHLVVALSTRESDYRSEAEFEVAVAAAASLGVQSFREERQLSVVTDSKALRALTGRLLLDLLSDVRMSPVAPDLVHLARNAATAAPDVSVAVLFCGGSVGAAELSRAGAAFPLGARVIAVKVQLGAAVGVRTIGTITVVTVGELDDLGRALRSVRA